MKKKMNFIFYSIVTCIVYKHFLIMHHPISEIITKSKTIKIKCMRVVLKIRTKDMVPGLLQ